MYYYSLAVAYHTAHQDHKSIETINELLKLPNKSPDDPGYKKEAERLIQKIQ
jgi:hypothetical protein